MDQSLFRNVVDMKTVSTKKRIRFWIRFFISYLKAELGLVTK